VAVEVVGAYTVPDNPDVCLIELTIDAPPSTVDVGGFTQEDPRLDPSSWQVPYDERYLSQDGTREIGERWERWIDTLRHSAKQDEPSTTRMVFFFHFLDSNRPLSTPEGEVSLPSIQTMPERLSFVEYEPPD
jgi:hypothetical protein